ncbi:hypothetical protein BDV32DRAFT_130740 [Aspergillus pseudonomiae]|nr:hypothetical protein BDV32DRAFT_130740 [Aspergillus pseudonomiae]
MLLKGTVLRRVFATVCVGDLLLLSLNLHFETDSTTSIEPYATAPSLNMAGPAAFPASSDSPTVSSPNEIRMHLGQETGG